MMAERDFEDILCKYPELIEEGLILKGRQVALYGRRMDILYEDKFGRKLIAELKIGPIKDAHIGQVLSYEGMLLSADDPTIRVMLIGNRVPPNVQRSLDHHGIAWREITVSKLKDFLGEKNDQAFLNVFDEECDTAEKKSRVTIPDRPNVEPPLPVLSPPRLEQTMTPSQSSRAATPGTQVEIIDAILGAYPYQDGKWLSAERQVELLQRAQDAKLHDGRKAFPAMQNWDGENRTNRMRYHHVKRGHALKADGRNWYMLAKGVTPAAIGVSQRVVDALAAYNVIPGYDVNETSHVASEGR